jgi:bifunctional non-homologous end joining protein LigD
MSAIPAPMLATPGGKPFTSSEWLYEIKYDGYRCMARVADGQVELRTKSGLVCTGWFPELARALSTISSGPHVIDGEACVLDGLGRSDFGRLRSRASRKRWYDGCDAVTLCAFDLLVENGTNIMGLPLVERKARLAKLLSDTAGVLVVGDLPAQAELFDRAVEPLLLGGFVAKRRGSPYQPGVRSSDWLKIKRKGTVPPQWFKR